MTAKAKLYYFPATGKGNQIRLALAAGGIDFEDVNATFPPSEEQVKEWRSIGQNTTTNVPMLVTADEKVYTQSSAVLRAVARMGNLLPPADDDDLQYTLDKILADCEDIRSAAYGSFAMFGAAKEKTDNFVSTVFPKHIGNLERQLGDADYFVGSKLTVADISVYDALVNFGAGCQTFEDFPKIKALLDRVAADPKIAAYLAGEQFAVLMKFDKNVMFGAEA